MHRPVVEVAVGSSGTQIQQAINSAVAQYNGQRPVVHIPKGTYNLANYGYLFPANSDVQLVGDGMLATVLVYNRQRIWTHCSDKRSQSCDAAPILASVANQRGDALDVSNIDQPGSRVFISRRSWAAQRMRTVLRWARLHDGRC